MGLFARWCSARSLRSAKGPEPGPQPREALELRIHGVHGTSPASMLGVKDPRQVAGDGITGVFRAGGELPRRKVRPGHAVEAYSWGALTSAVRGVLGWVQRVLWLFLLPFALINLAYWARLHVGQADIRGRWGAAVVRWAALLLTMTFVLTLGFVSLDLVAWQCYRGGTKSCDSLPGLLDFMMVLAPSQRIALAAVVPLAGIGVLWFLSRSTLARYEACQDSHRMREGEHLLQSTKFWSSTLRTLRLQRLHLAAAIATLMAYVGGQVDSLAGRLGPATVGAGLVLLVCFVMLARSHPQDLEYRPRRRTARRPEAWSGWLLRLVALGVVAQLGWLAVPAQADASRQWDARAGWFGHNLWFIGVVVAISVVNIAVFLAGRLHPALSALAILAFMGMTGVAAWLSLGDATWLSLGETQSSRVLAFTGASAAVLFLVLMVWQVRQRRRHASEAWNGGGSAMLIGASGWIALLFTTALVTASANYLNGPEQTVSDLTSFQGGVVDALAPDTVTGYESEPVVALSKDVVLRDGIVVMGPVPALVRGDLQVDTAEVADGDQFRALSDIVVSSGGFTMEDESLRLVDTCWVAAGETPPPSCHPETPGFVPGARVAVTGMRLSVADGGRVRVEVADPPPTPLVIPQVLIWAPIVQVLWVLLTGLLALACALVLRRRVGPVIREQVVRDGVPAESRVDVTSKRMRAAYSHRAERLLELLGALTVASVLLLLCLSATGLPPSTLVSDLFPEWRTELPYLVASLSLYVVLGLSAALILLSSYIRRSESTRKAVGILWDLTTFWPRAAHPLSPPCYAERVVPEMTTRIKWGLKQNGLVVVSGHSQGSLIAAATVIRLRPQELRRVRLVTYGSQLRALYGRIFPAVVGPHVLGHLPTTGTPTFSQPHPDVPDPDAEPPPATPAAGTLRGLLGAEGWVNFFRRGDPLGWRVFSDADSSVDVCTTEVPDPVTGDPGPTVMTHSGYQHSPEYRREVCGWLKEPLVDDARWTIGEVEPLPEP